MKSVFIFCVYLPLFILNCLGQELIVDTCFQNFSYKKNSKTLFAKNLKKWNIANNGTTDLFFNNNAFAGFRVPSNYVGFEQPFCEIAYIGICVLTKDIKHDGKNWREYISSKLKEDLKKNQLYCLTMQVSLADTCNFAADGLEAYFSKNKPKYPYTTNLPYEPQIRNIGGRIITNKKGWTKICSVYKAEGNEQYLTIGNFKDDAHTKLISVNDKIRKNDYIAESAYYYIGFVSLKPISSESECDYNAPIINVDTNQETKIVNNVIIQQPTFILKDINFEIDKSTLLIQSYPQLDSIANILKLTGYSIEISGHTDITGTEPHNLELSEARAQAVADYFIMHGILKKRLIIKGYGSSEPIADNKTEEGRKKNRRVEILIVKE